MGAARHTVYDSIHAVQAAVVRGRWFGLSIAALRGYFGLVYLSNGLAKFAPGMANSPFGFLIDSEGARGILTYEVLAGGARQEGHPFGLYRSLVEGLILPNWQIFGPLVALAEVGVGLLLVIGLLTPIAALGGAGLALHLQFATLFNNKWLFEYSIQWLPLIVLAVLRAGRWYGADALLAARWPRWWWW